MFFYFFEFMFQVVYVEVIIKFWLITTFLNKSHTTMGEKTLKTFHNSERQIDTIVHTKKKKKKTLSWINFRFLTKNMQIYVYMSF